MYVNSQFNPPLTPLQNIFTPIIRPSSFGSCRVTAPGPLGFFDSPPISPPSDSPPMSPNNPQLRLISVNELVASMRNFKLAKMQMSTIPPSCWVGSGFRSPRGPLIRPEFFSLPNTPTRTLGRCGPGPFDLWEQSLVEEPAMERVESGRDLRAG